jgi:hypothetical protein
VDTKAVRPIEGGTVKKNKKRKTHATYLLERGGHVGTLSELDDGTPERHSV